MQKKSYFCSVFRRIMEKISKAQVKLVRSLQQKKFRDESGLFVAEGEKCVDELRKAFELVYYIQTAEKPLPDLPLKGQEETILFATPTEIEQMSSLRTPQGVIGVFRKREASNKDEVLNQAKLKPSNNLTLVLDGVQDPGNLGTIIRTCDWFGVHDIFCSPDTADCYNPKVVQATMGALARVHMHYTNLEEWLRNITDPSIPIYGTLLDGRNMYEVLQSEGRSYSKAVLQQSGHAVIIMGNEGNGISQEVRQLITHPIRIPSYPKNAETSESLNVSIATAIVLAEFRRMDRTN